MTANPIACTLGEAERRARAAELRGGLLRRIRSTRNLPDGLALEFPGDPETAEQLRAFVAFEQGCCGFAEFTLRSDPGSGSQWLAVRGPDGTAAFWRSLAAGAVPAEAPPGT